MHHHYSFGNTTQRFASTHHSCVSPLSLTQTYLALPARGRPSSIITHYGPLLLSEMRHVIILGPKNHVHRQKLKRLHNKTNATHCPFKHYNFYSMLSIVIIFSAGGEKRRLYTNYACLQALVNNPCLLGKAAV